MRKSKTHDFVKKVKVSLFSKRGSILAYSLIIIAAMLAIASSLSVVTVLEKKGASSTEFSMQSLQTADSGVQMALKKIGDERGKATPGSLLAAIPDCGSSFVGPGGSFYTLTFSDETGVVDCNANVNSISTIKSIGTHRGTIRAVEVKISPKHPCDGAQGVEKVGDVYTLTDTRGTEEIKYPVVGIGTQCWMAENLGTAKTPAGVDLVDITNMRTNPSPYTKPWGRLYNWATAMNIDLKYNTETFDYSTLGLGYPAGGQSGMKIQGICSSGWHLPTITVIGSGTRDPRDDESQLLLFAMNLTGLPSNTVGVAFKSTDAAYWNSASGNTNVTGFSAVGAGTWYEWLPGFGGVKTTATFQSATQNGAGGQYSFGVSDGDTYDMGWGPNNKVGFKSVRCVAD